MAAGAGRIHPDRMAFIKPLERHVPGLERLCVEWCYRQPVDCLDVCDFDRLDAAAGAKRQWNRNLVRAAAIVAVMDCKRHRVVSGSDCGKIDIQRRSSRQVAEKGHGPGAVIEPAPGFDVVLVAGAARVVAQQRPVDDSAGQRLDGNLVTGGLVQIGDGDRVRARAVDDQLVLQLARFHLANGLAGKKVSDGLPGDQPPAVVEKVESTVDVRVIDEFRQIDHLRLAIDGDRVDGVEALGFTQPSGPISSR